MLGVLGGVLLQLPHPAVERRGRLEWWKIIGGTIAGKTTSYFLAVEFPTLFFCFWYSFDGNLRDVRFHLCVHHQHLIAGSLACYSMLHRVGWMRDAEVTLLLESKLLALPAQLLRAAR